MLTIDELKAKLKEDAEALEVINDMETKINTNYVEDNIKLKKECEKLKSDNLLLYSQLMNRGAKEEKEDAPFVDYSEQIEKALRNRKE